MFLVPSTGEKKSDPILSQIFLRFFLRIGWAGIA